ncbi:hypothetical protein PQQ63_08840 [Paraburkholderia metrosideri]|uniref:Uncharacterized protein n=1 Tax=Paraburkholderia metrosideri TaxID=580937 RepID=A0ABW9DS13_9BURK
MRPIPPKTNRFSHAYMHDPEKAYEPRALLDFNWRSYLSVAPARQISKKAKLSHTLLCVPLNFEPSHDLTEEHGVAIA